MVMGVFLFMQAVAAAIGEAFTSLSTGTCSADARLIVKVLTRAPRSRMLLHPCFVPYTYNTLQLLVWNYSVMAALAGIGGILFWVSFRSLDAEEKMLNELPEARYIAGSRESFE